MRPTTSESNDLTPAHIKETVLDLSAAAKRAERKVLSMKWHDDAGDKMGEESCESDLEMLKGQEDSCMMMIDVSDGPSNSNCADMNSNTNGKAMVQCPMDNTNDNRQQVLPDGPVLKKVKQISMEQQVPLNLTGLGLSGSGMQLFVKMDKSLEKCFGQAVAQPDSWATDTCQPPKTKRKKRSRSVIAKDTRRDLVRGPPINAKDDGRTGVLTAGSQSEQLGIPARHGVYGLDRKKREGTAERPAQDSELPRPFKSPQATCDLLPQEAKPCYPYACSQRYQPKTSQPQSKNVISGPIWNVQDGKIDVIKSLDVLQTSQNAHASSTSYDRPANCSNNPFLRGFESRDLPLKRQGHSSQERRGYTSPAMPRRRGKYQRRGYYVPYEFDDDDNDDDDDDDDDDNESFGDYPCHYEKGVRKYQKNDNRVVSKYKNKSQVKNSTNRQVKSSASDEDVRDNFARPKPKRKHSEMSNADVASSVGPRFETSLLQPNAVDAETLVKFTQFTQDLRKDLKQKYKDLMRLMKNFEQTVQERNNNQTEDKPNTDSSRCSVM